MTMKLDSIPDAESRQDKLYQEAAASYGTALERLVRGYEADPDRRRALEKLLRLIHGLKPLDRQIVLSYLEDMDAGFDRGKHRHLAGKRRN